MMSKWGISGVTIVTPDKEIKAASLTVSGNKIEKVSGGDLNTSISVDIEDGVLSPGLINSHDHLVGNYYPKVGNGPYTNWLPWDNDLKSSLVYAERQQIENRDLYLLAGYRNLISATTTVSDHIPHFVQDPFVDLLPMRAIKNYALIHSVNPLALIWGEGIKKEYQKAVKEDVAFITHIAEGFDEVTKQDLKTLDREGGLGDHSVLVHGLAFSDEDIKLIKQKGASVVWCADSNMFMFGRTANVKKLRETGVNLCIGTDSPMSGGENMLYEMKYGKSLYKRLYGEDLPDKEIVAMATQNGAKAFHLNKFGRIENGYIADFVVFKNRADTPYKSIVTARLADVRLVVIDGKPAYGDAEFSGLFDSLKIKYQKLRVEFVQKIVIGDLKGVLRRIDRAVGFRKEFPFMPVEFD